MDFFWRWGGAEAPGGDPGGYININGRGMQINQDQKDQGWHDRQQARRDARIENIRRGMPDNYPEYLQRRGARLAHLRQHYPRRYEALRRQRIHRIVWKKIFKYARLARHVYNGTRRNVERYARNRLRRGDIWRSPFQRFMFRRLRLYYRRKFRRGRKSYGKRKRSFSRKRRYNKRRHYRFRGRRFRRGRLMSKIKNLVMRMNNPVQKWTYRTQYQIPYVAATDLGTNTVYNKRITLLTCFGVAAGKPFYDPFNQYGRNCIAQRLAAFPVSAGNLGAQFMFVQDAIQNTTGPVIETNVRQQLWKSIADGSATGLFKGPEVSHEFWMKDRYTFIHIMNHGGQPVRYKLLYFKCTGTTDVNPLNDAFKELRTPAGMNYGRDANQVSGVGTGAGATQDPYYDNLLANAITGDYDYVYNPAMNLKEIFRGLTRWKLFKVKKYIIQNDHQIIKARLKAPKWFLLNNKHNVQTSSTTLGATEYLYYSRGDILIALMTEGVILPDASAGNISKSFPTPVVSVFTGAKGCPRVLPSRMTFLEVDKSNLVAPGSAAPNIYEVTRSEIAKIT